MRTEGGVAFTMSTPFGTVYVSKLEPVMHSSKPPSVDPAEYEMCSATTESESGYSSYASVSVLDEDADPSRAETLTLYAVPAAVSGVVAATVVHSSSPIELAVTVHVCTVVGTPVDVTIWTVIFEATEANPSPVRMSCVPPAALPLGVVVVVLLVSFRRTAVSDSTPLTFRAPLSGCEA